MYVPYGVKILSYQLAGTNTFRSVRMRRVTRPLQWMRRLSVDGFARYDDYSDETSFRYTSTKTGNLP